MATFNQFNVKQAAEIAMYRSKVILRSLSGQQLCRDLPSQIQSCIIYI